MRTCASATLPRALHLNSSGPAMLPALLPATARSGCIRTAPDRAGALEATVAGWAADMAEGRNAAMYAWRRANVAELNRLARERWRGTGRLGKEELTAPGGTTYAVGDRVVALAPGAGGKVV